MDDLDTLARDFGFGPRGKSNPMRSAPSDRRPVDDPLFSNVFGEPAKFAPSSNSKNNTTRDFDYDSIFNPSAASEVKKTDYSSSKTSSGPVYDKPVYDEDIFDGLPGLKSKSASSKVRYDNDVFASPPSSKSRNQNNDFDDPLGNFGRSEKAGENIASSSAKSSSSSKGFDDLLDGFGSGISAAGNRPITASNWGSVPVGGSKHGRVLDDPLVVSESASTQGFSSSRVLKDPLEEISKHGTSRSARTEASSGGGKGFDGLDALSGFAKPAHSFSPGKDKRWKKGSPSGSGSSQSAMIREQKGNASFGYSKSNMEKKTSIDNFQEPPLFDVPNVSTDFQKSFDQTTTPQYFETTSQVDMSPTSSGVGQQSDDVWLTVSEIPLSTHPTVAPPPSRPPPPIPRQTSRAETGSFSSSSGKKGDKFSSPSDHSQHFQSPKLAKPVARGPQVSQFDELEDFALGRSQNSVDESANLHSSEETTAFSTAAASAAAMKEAMERAEAKFRHAKEVREREYAKATKHKESVQLEKDEQDSQERDFRETKEILEHERNQKEEEEREQRRLQRERSREIEREKARHAVERANREARERAAAQARERAAAEAHLKAERAAVQKASAEARERAERVAVQRAQAEARGRAAAEAKERAENAAAEARARAAAAETREKELRDKASEARAEVEARRRAERAAVERAAAEARERAAAEARERAAAATAAKMNQQRNDDDLESFFSMGRASSAPKGRVNSTFQSKGGPEAGKRASSSSGASSNMKKASSTTNIVDDLSSIFGAPSAGEFQEVEGETEERRRARLERNQRTQERAAKALAEKNQRDLQAQQEQEERHRIAETLDIEIKRWAAGKEGNLRALLSTLQYVLWPECGWQPVSLTDLIMGASVKKVYRKATLCIHPDKVQQKGATLQQKYIAEKVFDLLKEAWNKFNSEELF